MATYPFPSQNKKEKKKKALLKDWRENIRVELKILRKFFKIIISFNAELLFLLSAFPINRERGTHTGTSWDSL